MAARDQADGSTFHINCDRAAYWSLHILKRFVSAHSTARGHRLDVTRCLILVGHGWRAFQLCNERLPIVEQSEKLKNIRVELIGQSVVQMDAATLLVELEFPIVVGKSTLGDDQVTEVDL